MDFRIDNKGFVQIRIKDEWFSLAICLECRKIIAVPFWSDSRFLYMADRMIDCCRIPNYDEANMNYEEVSEFVNKWK